MAGREFKPYTSAIPLETKDVTLVDMMTDTFGCTLQEKIAMLREPSEGVDLVAIWVGYHEHRAFRVDPDRALTDIIQRAQQGRTSR